MKDDDHRSAPAVHTENDPKKDREVTTEEFLDFVENLLADLGYPIPENEKAPKVLH